MDPLGDPEEVGVAADRRPSGVDAGAARVGEQRLQHLGHAAAARGRVDVPDDASREQRSALGDRLLDLCVVGAQ